MELCYIKEQYFAERRDFQKMLDPGNSQKQSSRAYLCVEIILDENFYYLPLRNNLKDAVRKFGRIGHSIPSHKRPYAGIDYRYALLINDSAYIEKPDVRTIPHAQIDKIRADYAAIQAEFQQYVSGFQKAARKNRIDREPLYRESSLINFLDEMLGRNSNT